MNNELDDWWESGDETFGNLYAIVERIKSDAKIQAFSDAMRIVSDVYVDYPSSYYAKTACIEKLEAKIEELK
jgi:hypothetical protein